MKAKEKIAITTPLVKAEMRFSCCDSFLNQAQCRLLEIFGLGLSFDIRSELHYSNISVF